MNLILSFLFVLNLFLCGATCVGFSKRSNLAATTCLQANVCVCFFQMPWVSRMLLLLMKTKSLLMAAI